MNIALMSHDHKKELMVQFCIAYCGVCPSTPSAPPTPPAAWSPRPQACPSVCSCPMPMAAASRSAPASPTTRLTWCCFLRPPVQRLDPDLKYINQMCDQYNIPFATNAATAEILIHGLGRAIWTERDHQPSPPVTVRGPYPQRTQKSSFFCRDEGVLRERSSQLRGGRVVLVPFGVGMSSHLGS